MSAAALVAALFTVAVGTVPDVAPPAGPSPGAGGPAADGPVVPEPFATRLVDVALLPPGGRDGAPRLLTVAPDAAIAGRTHLSVLERGGGRWSTRAGAVDEPPMLGQTGTPWLVGLDADRSVLIAVAPELGETWLRTVSWTGERLALGARVAIGRQIDAAGTADVDGDGAVELVLTEARTRRGGPTCQGSTIVTVAVPTLEVIDEIRVDNLRLAAGAVGELDGTPGAELVASASRNCPAGPATADRLVLAALRLSDGRVLTERPLRAADALTASSGRPAIVDVDHDGRTEVLVGGPRGMLIVEPAAGWRETVIPGTPGVLLGAAERSEPQGAIAAALGREGLVAALLTRRDGGWAAADVARIGPSEVTGERWEAAGLDTRASAIRSGGGAGWLDRGAGCDRLVVTLAVVDCDGEGVGLSPGPAWLATRPLVRLGPTDGSLVVAQTDAWPSVPARLVAPAPLAAERPGTGWRHGPSETFSLSEVAASALGSPDAPTATADRWVRGGAPVIGVAAPPGSRLIASVAAGDGDASPDEGLARLLAVPRRPGWDVLLVRLPAGGPTPGRAELALPPGATATPPSWTVAVATIGPLGDVSALARSRAVLDVSAPDVAVDDAWLRLPWPFTAGLTGVSEPGATITDGRATATAGRDGRFTLEVRLAPWPQRLEIRARDAAGNEQPLVVDVVGGPDLRVLPWVPILATVLVAGAALGGLRARRGPIPSPAPDGPAIEELDPRRLR